MYQLWLDAGADVLVIPPFPNRFVSRDSRNERERQLLGALIANAVSKQAPAAAASRAGGGCGKPRLHLLRLPDEYFNFWSMPAGRVAEYQDDLLHLKPVGYDLLGSLVFGAISKQTPLEP